MNPYFSLRRFGLLLRLDLAQNKKTYLLSGGLILGLLLLLMLPILEARNVHGPHLSLHMTAYAVGLLLGGSLFSSTAFGPYSSQPRGIATLMVPASQLEKFLAPFLVHLVFLLVFLVLFWMLHYGLISVANSRLLDLNPKASLFQPIPSDALFPMSYLYLLALAACFAGSIYFAKNAFIKTAALLLAVLTGFFFFNIQLAKALTSHNLFALPFEQWRFLDPHMGGRMFTVEYPEPVQGLIWAGLLMVVVGLWYLAYIRLKEKEI